MSAHLFEFLSLNNADFKALPLVNHSQFTKKSQHLQKNEKENKKAAQRKKKSFTKKEIK
jgi:hypothetical protein